MLYTYQYFYRVSQYPTRMGQVAGKGYPDKAWHANSLVSIIGANQVKLYITTSVYTLYNADVSRNRFGTGLG